MQPNLRQDSQPTSENWIRCVQSVAACARTLRRLLVQNLADAGINDVEFLLLWSCQTHRTLPQNQLVPLLAVSPAQLSTTIDRLVQRQLVETRRQSNDRRRQFVKLTEPGRRVLNQALACLNNICERFDEQVAATEQSLLVELLNRLSGDHHGLHIFVPNPDESQCGDDHAEETQ